MNKTVKCRICKKETGGSTVTFVGKNGSSKRYCLSCMFYAKCTRCSSRASPHTFLKVFVFDTLNDIRRLDHRCDRCTAESLYEEFYGR